MKVDFSLSPGGLLLPYHMGALASLQYHGRLNGESQVAGSSAGAIATMAYGCGLDPKKILEATIAVSDQCHELGGARGRLLPLLEEQMEGFVGEEEMLHLKEERDIGIAYTQIFPRKRSFLQSEFDSKEDLFRAVSWSCMFPFFATNWPCLLDTSQGFPRLMVDGFFSVPRDRFGCPDFQEKSDRTVGISVFPKNSIGIEAFDDHDCISPSVDSIPMEELLRLATSTSSRDELTKVFESGFQDAEAWCFEEKQREKKKEQKTRELNRQSF